MSIKRMSAVWEHSKQEKVKLLILLSLADRADDDGYCWPSRSDIAKRSRCSERYVTTAINEIEIDGELAVNERAGTTHQFIVTVGMTEDEITAAKKRRFMGVEPSSGVNPSSRGGGTALPGGGGTPRLVEPSLLITNETSIKHRPISFFLQEMNIDKFKPKYGAYQAEDLCMMLKEAAEIVGYDEYVKIIEWNKGNEYKHIPSRVKAILTAAKGWAKDEPKEKGTGGRLI